MARAVSKRLTSAILFFLQCMLAPIRLRPGLTASAMASTYQSASKGPHYFSTTSLGRWSVLNKQLPASENIKTLHVYDFDNTLFKTPTPNPFLWNVTTISKLSSQYSFLNGGWWHDSRFLAATGEGVEKEQPRAWEGWWNETIVELVRMSMQQSDALCILLTGRAENTFADLIKTMIASKGLEFDIVGLKPSASPANETFRSTMHFKKLFLTSLVETYRDATKIQIFEDRPKHAAMFRDFFTEFNRRQTHSPTRGPLAADVVQVLDTCVRLDPVTEVAQVQHMLNQHNETLPRLGQTSSGARLRIKKTVLSTSYVIGTDDAKKIVGLAQIPAEVSNQDLKHYGSNIVISVRDCPPNVLEKVGGLGAKMLWEVTGIGSLNDNLWAARLRPVPATAVYHTDETVPLVVLAVRNGARPSEASRITNWKPMPSDETFVFETTVGEKVILRVEAENPDEDEAYNNSASRPPKRKHMADDEWSPQHHRSSNHNYAGRNESRAFHSNARGRGAGSHRGGGGGSNRGNRGGGRGARGSRGGRGGYHGYRSLDDVDSRADHGGLGSKVDYDDAYRPPPSMPANRGRGLPPPPGRGGIQLPPRPVASDPDLRRQYC
ncbi:hypothetical protein XA68_10403 [Ophiocordyceps unilateralis]|uniref:Swiss Army Knife RNA repair protein HAD domain-containing protein n=1 Tax=Ophiocordyceps unilateralis TaxID=268505 RepID=A0A2A9PPL7_OPHUN|nr:hypothetical protein XA68_10403 [Ophiocordyceps unilateralis]